VKDIAAQVRSAGEIYYATVISALARVLANTSAQHAVERLKGSPGQGDNGAGKNADGHAGA
jgi:hypothetical protein